jgi:hypothetical protein
MTNSTITILTTRGAFGFAEATDWGRDTDDNVHVYDDQQTLATFDDEYYIATFRDRAPDTINDDHNHNDP